METINTFYNDYASLKKFVQCHHDTFFSPQKKGLLVQIFSSRCDKGFLERLAAEVSSLVPQAVIMGTTTSGGIINGQVRGLGTILTFTIFHYSEVKIASFPKTDQDDYELGRTIASRLGSESGKILILFAAGQSVDAREMLLGIESVCPELPVAGGKAGNNSSTQSLIVCGRQVIENGAVGVTLEGESLKVKQYFHLGWQPIGKEMTITKADGLRVHTIDDLPAYEIYRKYLGLTEARDFNIVREYPLIVKRHGIEIARTPFIRYEDDSIGFAGDLVQGEKISLSFGDIGMISEAIIKLCREIKKQHVESIFVYSCESRRGFLQEHSNIETEPLQEIAPTSGFFTHGEFFPVGATNQVLNATMTVVVLSEGEGMPKSGMEMTCDINNQDGNNSSRDNVGRRSTGVLQALTHLVNTVTAELVAANKKLAYVSLHDYLTGLYNRTAFELEMKKLENTASPGGVIVCDLDCLKLLNDALGHDFGDHVLQLASGVLRKSCSPENIVARIGGDEFAIIIPNADLVILDDICNKILREAANERRLNPKKPLYLSVGFAYQGQKGIENIRDAFKMADRTMYQHKLVRARQIKQKIIHILKGIDGADWRW